MNDGWLWLSMRMRHRDAVADVDDAGVLARADEDLRALGRQPAEWTREDLYEQCSLHMTEYIASSRSFGCSSENRNDRLRVRRR